MSENGNKKSNKTKSQNYSSKQRQLQIQHENTVWSIEDVVDGPKIEMVGGKKRKMYKVRWSESYELASNIPDEMIDLYEKRGKKQIKILGPLVSNKETASGEKQDTSPNSQLALQKTRFAVEIGDDVQFMSYKQVKTLYKEELLEYFEERAKIEE
uniref:Chromo domain-containing protein n=1 Tax=Meloidogyne incognita TaxID=6306 RepID=A0A914LSP0_MELIC